MIIQHTLIIKIDLDLSTRYDTSTILWRRCVFTTPAHPSLLVRLFVANGLGTYGLESSSCTKQTAVCFCSFLNTDPSRLRRVPRHSSVCCFRLLRSWTREKSQINTLGRVCSEWCFIITVAHMWGMLMMSQHGATPKSDVKDHNLDYYFLKLAFMFIHVQFWPTNVKFDLKSTHPEDLKNILVFSVLWFKIMCLWRLAFGCFKISLRLKRFCPQASLKEAAQLTAANSG